MGIEVSECVTIPAAAKAMGVSRIVIERAIKAMALESIPFHTGSNGAGFRLIPSESLKGFLVGRKGYYSVKKDQSTMFQEWDGTFNPKSIVAEALAITKGPEVVAAKPKAAAKPKPAAKVKPAAKPKAAAKAKKAAVSTEIV